MLKLRRLWKENRFLAVLIALLAIGAIASFWLGHDPSDSWIDASRSLSSSLTAELIGTMIGVLVVNELLKRHHRQSLQALRRLVLSRVYWLCNDTVFDSVNAIPQPDRDDAIDGRVFQELFNLILSRNFSLAIERLPEVFKSPCLLRRTDTWSSVEEVASHLLSQWHNLLDVFGQHLEPPELASSTQIINHLESVVSACESAKHGFKHYGRFSDEGHIAESLLKAHTEVLKLMQVVSDQAASVLDER